MLKPRGYCVSLNNSLGHAPYKMCLKLVFTSVLAVPDFDKLRACGATVQEGNKGT